MRKASFDLQNHFSFYPTWQYITTQPTSFIEIVCVYVHNLLSTLFSMLLGDFHYTFIYIYVFQFTQAQYLYLAYFPFLQLTYSDLRHYIHRHFAVSLIYQSSLMAYPSVFYMDTCTASCKKPAQTPPYSPVMQPE
jgi:hypothetical protein